MDRPDEQSLFVTIVEAQSVHEAAARLGLSASSVSRQLKRLEEKLGTVLLHRTTRSLSVTPQGKIYYQSCKRIEEEKRTTRQQMLDLTSNPTGRIKLTVTPAFNYAQLINCIADFRDDYPKITFELNVTDKQLDLANEGIDIAIRIGLLQDSRYKARKLMPSVLVPCASQSYIDKHGVPSSIEDLTNHMLVASSHLHAIEKRQTELSQLELKDEQKVMRVNDVVSIYQAVLQGIGLSFLPDYLIGKDLESGVLTELLPELPRSQHEVYALFSNSDYLPLKTRLFVDHLAQRFTP